MFRAESSRAGVENIGAREKAFVDDRGADTGTTVVDRLKTCIYGNTAAHKSSAADSIRQT